MTLSDTQNTDYSVMSGQYIPFILYNHDIVIVVKIFSINLSDNEMFVYINSYVFDNELKENIRS